MRPLLAPLALVALLAAPATAQDDALGGRYARWELGPPDDPDFFPIGVWLQDPRLAPRYRALGVNTFVGLWQGPTEEQLAACKRAGVKVVCAPNPVGRAHVDDPTIIAWMQIDEPDNIERSTRKVRATPEALLARYERIRSFDPRRPVLLNLGQGIANPRFKGRGAKMTDYPDYAQAADLLSFDVYPVANLGRDDGDQFLWMVARGVERLREWGGPERPVWNVIECTAIRVPAHKPTPQQVRVEVWMSIVAGSRGIVYFCHEMEPKVKPAALLADQAMAAAVRGINQELLRLAPILNTPDLEDAVRVESDPDAPVAALAKRHGDAVYVFAVGMRDAPAQATFQLLDNAGAEAVEVLDEERSLPLEDGRFTDTFEPYAVHLYRLQAGD